MSVSKHKNEQRVDACAENNKEEVKTNSKKKKQPQKLSFLSTVGNKLIPTSWEPMGAGETPSLFPGKLSPFSSSSSLLSPSLFGLSRSLLSISVYIVSHSLSLSSHFSLSLLFSFYHYICLSSVSWILPLALSSFLCASPSIAPSLSLPPFPYHPVSLSLLSVCLLLSFFLALSLSFSLSPSISLSLSLSHVPSRMCLGAGRCGGDSL